MTSSSDTGITFMLLKGCEEKRRGQRGKKKGLRWAIITGMTRVVRCNSTLEMLYGRGSAYTQSYLPVRTWVHIWTNDGERTEQVKKTKMGRGGIKGKRDLPARSSKTVIDGWGIGRGPLTQG